MFVCEKCDRAEWRSFAKLENYEVFHNVSGWMARDQRNDLNKRYAQWMVKRYS